MPHRLLPALFALVLASCVADAAEPFKPDPATVRRYGPAYRYPQSGWTVLHIEGEPFDRGYQHGRLMAEEIAGYVKTLALEQSAKDPAAGWKLTRTLVNAVFLRKFDREYLDEMKGIADGAAAAGAKFEDRPIDLLDIAAMNLVPEYDTLDGALEAQPTGLEGVRFPKPPAPRCCPPAQKDHCSAFAATGPATADGKIVFGHITMWGLSGANFFNVWLDVKPAKGHRILMQSYPGGIQSGMDYYLNSAGIMVTETTIRQTRFNPDGTPLASRIRKALQYGNSIDDVVKALTERNNGLYTNEWLIGDANTNEIAMLELGTSTHRLRRSSKNEWLLPGTEGFYWGCNNTKDLQVRLDTYSSLTDRPQSVSWRPSDRDKAWLTLYSKYRGKVDAEFGKLAFSTPPLSAHPSLDAKVTTTDMVKRLESHALFGPPYGRLWAPTMDQADRTDIRALVPNDWAVLTGVAPHKGDVTTAADIFERIPEPETEPAELPTSPAWHGTLLPKTDADLGLTAAFAEYERIVALENALREKSDGKLTDADKERIDLALFRYRADYQSAKGLAPAWRDGKAPDPIAAELDRDRFYSEQIAHAVLTLRDLREFVGAAPFAEAMDAFGRANAGKEVTCAQLFEAVRKHTGKDVAGFLEHWKLPDDPGAVSAIGWMRDPETVLIVYGTHRDRVANEAAAKLLQESMRDRWSNISIPVKADKDTAEADLKGKHVVLIGRSSVNTVGARFDYALPAQFPDASAKVRGKVYAHEGTAIIAAAANPLDPLYTVTIVSGHSADATYRAVEALMKYKGAASDVLVMPNGGRMKPVLVARPAAKPTTPAGG